jgi:hypothetical protein
MKKSAYILTLLCVLIQGKILGQTATLSGEITGSVSLSNDTIYIIEGFVYIKDGGLLFIEPGTILRGDKDSKGTLICTKTGILLAQGTPEQPIVFTSNEPEGTRAAGDWGGVIILGEAPINVPGGTAIIEGGIDTPDGDGEYGGANSADVSGGLQYVRIEYAGIAFTPGNEINGLTLGGVGNATLIDHVMVSYSGDDSFEFFGGTVNASYLISHGALDDDFDTDFGWSGKVQYAVALRDPNYADVSGSNAFESDNDGTGSDNTPITKGVFSNVTVIGPYQSVTDVINPNYKRGAHIRRNSELNIHNSVFTGFPFGLMIDGASCESNADSDLLEFKNNVLAGHGTNFEVAAGSLWDIDSWFADAAYGNSPYATVSEILLSDPFAIGNPDLRPSAGSVLLSGADFSDSDLDASFFVPGEYIGAFGESENWFGCWVNWNPQATNYSSVAGGTVAPTTANFTFSGVEDTYEVIFENLSENADEYFWDFGVAALTDDTSSLSNPSYLYSAPGSYEVCLNAYGCTTAEICLTVTVDTGGVQPAIDQINWLKDVKLYPNPAIETAFIQFDSQVTETINLSILSMNGQVVYENRNISVMQGANLIDFSVTELATGYYMIFITTNSGIAGYPVMIQR